MEKFLYMDIFTLMTSVAPDRSLGFTITVIVAGLGIVLATLAVLIIVFRCFGLIMEKSQAAQKKKEAKKMQKEMESEMAKVTATPAVPAPAPVVEDGISGEVVAAISAAIYTLEGAGATITTIKRKQSPAATRNPWANAAVVENTRPF